MLHVVALQLPNWMEAAATFYAPIEGYVQRMLWNFAASRFARKLRRV